MSDLTLVCKHCGAKAERIAEDVTCYGWREVDIDVAENGKIVACGYGSPQDLDMDVVGYTCGGCGKSAPRIEDLVVAQAGEVGETCGRCGHDITDHPELGWNPKRAPHFTRGPMPCSCGDCDCHDFYSARRALEAVA